MGMVIQLNFRRGILFLTLASRYKRNVASPIGFLKITIKNVGA